MTETRIEKLLDFDGLHVLVIGDIMLDEYIIGNVTRISPEAPVPVVNMQSRVHRLGGAANVAMNTSSLGAFTSLIGLIGNDENGQAVTKLTTEQEDLKAYLIQDHGRKTTCKTRVLAANQNLLRIDFEDDFPVDQSVVKTVENMLKYIQHERPIDVIILQDYNKGFFSDKMIRTTIQWARKNKIKTAFDPKVRNIDLFKGVDIFKPNLKELKAFLGREIEIEQKALESACREVLIRMECDLVVLTLSSHGVILVEEEKSHWESTSIQSIVDVSGAGDTVISVASLLYTKGEGSLKEMGQISNYAGAAVCRIPGVAIVNKSMIMNVKDRIQ